jgi:mannose-6-phosphate isomerase-like protein (cupin superfamily)
MRREHVSAADKGWYLGPWNSPLAISVGYANAGIHEPHLHTQITEIYLVARGSARIRVEQDTIQVAAGDLIAIEAGEAHTFLSHSPDYFHFVIHAPGLAGEGARAEKRAVAAARLGL